MTNDAGRFAPSPTSDLHLGNLRTALLAWLWARAEGRDFLLRIEDLDQQRVAAAPEVATRQLDDLRALGIDWDGEVVRQSERLHLYHEAAADLETYECFCTRREIAEASQAPNGGPGAPSWRPYPGTCAKLSTAQRDERRLTRAPAIRVRAEGAHFTVDDVHAGPVSGPVDDFVLFRADRTPAYNLAVVVDDGLQGIGQVVRGDDLLDSSPRQGWLATQLGFEVPRYVHVSLALNTDGQRLAKRDGAVTLADLAAMGRSPADVLAMLCDSAGLERGRDAAEVLARLRPGDLVNDLAWTPWVVTERAVPPARR
ncbi:MAG: tRNA glutamyl-Q(34) synthetase GluQRS [Luteococcus sp.]|uniref:tRNA glutamyl-Q(34) synthetase GluQRS n=1 Tax=Luteococcus sp. TaxID=1969402 RepID=UPI00264722F3|nr:tRNA glutamyl-Q(34) synthetase GluQRS [Luteococcus sp.]MDN5562992.1 tRNA glutamyl-Q(34) synthetase GluQRS [Luteococcus sp.]